MILSPAEIEEARRFLGVEWGLGRSLTLGELARCLEMTPHAGSRRTHTDVGQDIQRRATGPQSVAIRAMIAGFIPEGAPEAAHRRARYAGA